MITAIIRSEAAAEALARTLSPLVRGVVEGLISEVQVVADAGDTESAVVAEASGAALIAAASWGEGCARAAASARGEHLLVLEAGVILADAFWPELADRLAAGLARPLATKSGAGFFAALGAAVSGRPGRDQALILSRRAMTGDPWLMRLRATEMAAPAYRLPAKR